MARVTYGDLVTELAGSIGGVTFQKNSSGNIARLRPKTPVNPSQPQSDQQGLIARLVSAWGYLSLIDKGSWDTFAAAHTHFTPWGKETTLNGFQWYLSCNLNLLITSQATIDTAPSFSSISPPAAFEILIDPTYFMLYWDPSLDISGHRLLVYATAPLRMNSEKLRRSILLIRQYDGETVSFFHLMTYYQTSFNLTWSDLISSANCTIIVHAKLIEEATGLSSTYTSGSIKIS